MVQYYRSHWFEPSIAHRDEYGPRPALEQDPGAIRFLGVCYPSATRTTLTEPPEPPPSPPAT